MLYFDATLLDLAYFAMPYTSYESWGDYVLGHAPVPTEEPGNTVQDATSKD